MIERDTRMGVREGDGVSKFGGLDTELCFRNGERESPVTIQLDIRVGLRRGVSIMVIGLDRSHHI